MARFYIRDLAAYNNGIEHGVWIDTDTVEATVDLRDVIGAMLATSPVPHAEEWELADCEGITRELAQTLPVARWDEYAELVERHGEAYEVWANDIDHHDEALDEAAFQEQYAGAGEWRDFVYDFVQDAYGHELNKLPDSLRYHFDYESFGRDLAHDYNVIGDYIFRCV